jgi:hypothetical protein
VLAFRAEQDSDQKKIGREAMVEWTCICERYAATISHADFLGAIGKSIPTARRALILNSYMQHRVGKKTALSEGC